MSDQATNSEFSLLTHLEKYARVKRRIMFDGGHEQEHFLLCEVEVLREALQEFVTQVDEFHAGEWDERDWTAAKTILTEIARRGKWALRGGGS